MRPSLSGVEGECPKHGATVMDQKTGKCRLCHADRPARSKKHLEECGELARKRRAIEDHQARTQLREWGL